MNKENIKIGDYWFDCSSRTNDGRVHMWELKKDHWHYLGRFEPNLFDFMERIEERIQECTSKCKEINNNE